MRRRAWTLAAAIIWMATGSGCAFTGARYIQEPLPLPPRPVLPALTAEDLACLPAEVYERLVRRDLLRRQYAEELEAIIRATHQEDD